MECPIGEMSGSLLLLEVLQLLLEFTELLPLLRYQPDSLFDQVGYRTRGGSTRPSV